MKKLILFTTAFILINSNLNAIGFPHGYSKKKKIENAENHKNVTYKSDKKIYTLGNSLIRIIFANVMAAKK